jgi:LCP family protein required for cell wall assembly
LVLLAALLTVGGVVAYRTRLAFQEVQSISTPPPEVSGSALGLEDDVSIDTGPAQEAIRQRQQQESQQGNDATQKPEPSQTAPPASESSDSSGVASSGTEEIEPTSKDDSTSASSTVESTSTSDQRVADIATDTPSTASPDGPSATSSSRATQEPTQTSSDETVAAEDSNLTSTPGEGTSAGLDLPDDGTPGSVMSTDPPELVSTDGITVLLMGVDARDGESIDIGVRPDSLAVLHIDTDTGDCRMLAVPRDSRAELPGYGQSKINHALAVGGIPYEMLVVEEYLGIQLDNYVLVDFAGVETVVDELGGITVENPETFEIGGQTFEAGTLNLNGERALLYSRFRGDSDGDFGRISRQQQVLRGLLNEVADVNLVRIVPNMFSLLSDHFRTDYGMTDLIDLANTYRSSCSSESIETDTIDGDVSMEFDDLMQMELSFVVSDPAVVAENVAWLLMEEESTDPPDDERTPVVNSRREDDIQSTSLARSIELAGGTGPH